jgi:hypothetical protein
MKGYDPTFVRTFTFQNTSKETHTITNIDFAKKEDIFSFVSFAGDDVSLPLEVKPGETFTVKVAFRAFERNLTYSDKMQISTEESRQGFEFPIQALQQPLSSMVWNQHSAK